MVKNTVLLRKFEREYVRTEKLNHGNAFKIAEALYKESIYLGRSFNQDPLAGIEVKIRIAKAVNHVRPTPRQNCDRAQQV
jgi:hypothetical protein